MDSLQPPPATIFIITPMAAKIFSAKHKTTVSFDPWSVSSPTNIPFGEDTDRGIKEDFVQFHQQPVYLKSKDMFDD
jgi:hypothetical protein